MFVEGAKPSTKEAGSNGSTLGAGGESKTLGSELTALITEDDAADPGRI